jgi:hypothetical protein
MNSIGTNQTDSKIKSLFVDSIKGGLIDGSEFKAIILSTYQHSPYLHKRKIASRYLARFAHLNSTVSVDKEQIEKLEN